MNSARRFARRAEHPGRPAGRLLSRKSRNSLARRGFLRRGLMAERLEARSLLASDVFVSDFWNGARPEDVNADTHISPVDALLVINELNTAGTRTLTGNGGEPPPINEGEGESPAPVYYDVNNDGHVSPVDALMVINALNGEGEPPLVKLQVYIVNVGTQVSELATPPSSITSIPKGQDYEMVVTVKDLRAGSPLGIGVAHLDVFYDKALTSVFVREARDVVFTGSITGGTFTLSFRGQTTGPITFDPFSTLNTKNNIEDALEALSTIQSGNVFVTEESGLRFRVHFDNALGDQNIPNTGTDQLTINATGLTGGGTGSIEQFADGTLADPEAFEEAFRSRPGFPTNNAAYYRGQPLFNAGDASDRVDDLGGSYLVTAEPFPRSNVFERELARVRMNANDAGFVFFTPSVAVLDRPAHDTGLYTTTSDQQTLVNPADIVFGPDAGFGAGVVRLEITEPVEANPDIINRAEDSGLFTFNPISGTSNASVTIGADETNPGGTGQPLRITAVNGVSTPNVDIALPSGSIVRFSDSTTSPEIRYTPFANLNGTPAETFTYTISDTVNTDTTTVTVNLTAVNDAPVNRINGSPINGTPARNGIEDTAFVFNAANSSVISISDVDSGSSTNNEFRLDSTNGTITLVSTSGLTLISGNNGTAVMRYSGSLANINNALNGMVFNPTPEFNGHATVTVFHDDNGNTGGGDLTDTDTIDIDIAARNDAPTNAVPGTQNVVESTNLVFSPGNGNAITVADVDAAGGPFDSGRLIVQVTSAQGRTITANTSGSAIITPFGTGGVQIRGSASEINTALNGLTYAAGSFLSASTDTIVILTNDQGNTGTSTEQSNDGVAPDPLTRSDTIPITIEAARRPFAVDDSFTRPEGPATFTMDVMKFLSGQPGEDLFTLTSTPFIVSVTQPANTVVQGTVAVSLGVDGVPSADDRIVYMPPAGNAHYFGTVQFTYTINESPASSDGPDTATVTLVITPDNDNPEAFNDPQVAGAYETDEDINLVVSAANGVLANDTDLDNTQDQDGDGDPDPTQTLRAVLVTDAANGTVTLNDDGSFTYDPDQDFAGPSDSFTYHVEDGAGGVSNVATVTILVNPVDDSPEANNDPTVANDPNYSTPEGQPLNVSAANGVLDNDTDVDTAPAGLTAIIVSQPASGQGSVALAGDGSFTYTPPNSDFNGTVTFTYKANDGNSDSNVATVTIRVSPVNDPPVVADDPNVSTSEDVAVDINVLANDSDVDLDTLSVQFPLVDPPDHGTITVNGNGTLRYTPDDDYHGPDSFQYRAFDGTAASATGGTLNDGVATVSIVVSEFNDPPVAVNDGTALAPLQTNEDTNLVIDVVANDNDGDDEAVQTLTPVNVSALSNPAAGTLAVQGNGTILFDPADNFFGDVSFTYQARDNGAPNQTSANTATVFLRVVEQNDNPTAFDDSFTAIKDFVNQPIDVLGGDLPHDTIAPDVGETLTITGVSTTGAAGTFASEVATAQGGTVTVVGNVVHYDSPPGFASPPLDTFFYQISDGRGGTDVAQVSVEVLAFVPKIVEGVVYIDADNNGLIFGGEAFTDTNTNGVYDAGEAFVDSVGGPRDNNKYDPPEKRVQGVKVQLSGTDFQNNAVFFEATTDANGRYRFLGSAATQFQGMQPGTYTVTQIQPNYLTDGLETETSALASIGGNDEFDISWGPQDFSGHITGLNFGERGINTSSLADASGMIQEILASSGPNGLVMSVDLDGNYVWSWAMPGWANMLQCTLDLDADLAHATLTITDGQGTYTIRIHQDPDENNGVNSPPAGSMARFRVLGHSASGDYLIRLDGTAQDFLGFQLLAAAPIVGEGEAEGEAVDPQYAEAVDAVFGDGEAWA
jgi:VCBS repeat-containing protein